MPSTVAHRPETRPDLCSSRNCAHHRRPPPPRGSRARSGHPSSTKPTACSISAKQKASGLTCRRAARHELLNTPPKARHRCWSGAPTRRERAPEDKIRDAAAACHSFSISSYLTLLKMKSSPKSPDPNGAPTCGPLIKILFPFHGPNVF